MHLNQDKGHTIAMKTSDSTKTVVGPTSEQHFEGNHATATVHLFCDIRASKEALATSKCKMFQVKSHGEGKRQDNSMMPFGCVMPRLQAWGIITVELQDAATTTASLPLKAVKPIREKENAKRRHEFINKNTEPPTKLHTNVKPLANIKSSRLEVPPSFHCLRHQHPSSAVRSFRFHLVSLDLVALSWCGGPKLFWSLQPLQPKLLKARTELQPALSIWQMLQQCHAQCHPNPSLPS